tara:strand:+ start:283 stop:564 length:282 start_codon:yes stop_codon:yes gene_type:complete
MDWKTSLDWYCSGHQLDEEDLQILEIQYEEAIDNREINNSFKVAPKHICNQTKIPEGSTWILAVAVVLDRLSPLENSKPRRSIIDNMSRGKRS